MTSKKELERQLDQCRKNYTEASEGWRKADSELHNAQQENAAQAKYIEAMHEQSRNYFWFIDDILVIEPQLKHLLTHGVWDFERVHRAAEHLRGEDALESVGYTSNCAFPDNVTPLFPTDPSESGRGAA